MNRRKIEGARQGERKRHTVCSNEQHLSRSSTGMKPRISNSGNKICVLYCAVVQRNKRLRKGLKMTTWLHGSYHHARAKFVAQVVRRFGFLASGGNGGESFAAFLSPKGSDGVDEMTKWNDAMANISMNGKQTLAVLGVETLDDANVGMYSCIVAVSRYKWGVRGPPASSKRVWVQEGRKLTGTDMIQLIESLPEHNDDLQEEIENSIETLLPHVTCSLCKKPIPDLRPWRVRGRCAMRCSPACKHKELRDKHKMKKKDRAKSNSILQWLR